MWIFSCEICWVFLVSTPGAHALLWNADMNFQNVRIEVSHDVSLERNTDSQTDSNRSKTGVFCRVWSPMSTVIFLYWARYMGTWVFRSDADRRNISLGNFSSLRPSIWDSLFGYVRLGPGWMYFGRGCWKTLNYFHSPLQNTYPSDVNFLSKFTLTYNGSNDILISLYGWCFISFFFFKVGTILKCRH